MISTHETIDNISCLKKPFYSIHLPQDIREVNVMVISRATLYLKSSQIHDNEIIIYFLICLRLNNLKHKRINQVLASINLEQAVVMKYDKNLNEIMKSK